MFSTLKKVATALLCIALSACYPENLELNKVNTEVAQRIISSLQNAGIENVRCHSAGESTTNCFALDKSGYSSSFLLPLRIRWQQKASEGNGTIELSQSGMSQFNPKTLVNLIILEHHQDRFNKKNFDLWKTAEG